MRINRTISKAVYALWLRQINAKTGIPENSDFSNIKEYLSSHVEGNFALSAGPSRKGLSDYSMQ